MVKTSAIIQISEISVIFCLDSIVTAENNIAEEVGNYGSEQVQQSPAEDFRREFL
jgi:hypothetical protein